MKRSFIFTFLIMTLFSCKSLVHKFDERLEKKYLQKGFVSKTIESFESKIHFYDNQLNDKPVIILVHGFGGDGKISWWQQAKVLCNDYRVIVPDILWFGKSYSEGDPSLIAQIEMIQTIIKSEALTEVNLVGISYGGFISLGYAKKYAQSLKTLTIVDSPGAALSTDEISEFCKRVGAESVEDAFIPETAQEVDRLMRFSFRNPPMLTDGLKKETIGLYFSKHPEKQAQLLEELPDNRAWIAGQVDVPTLILWGEDDQVFLVREAKQLQKMLNAELKIIEKAGHALPEEQPKKFNQYLIDFITQEIE